MIRTGNRRLIFAAISLTAIFIGAFVPIFSFAAIKASVDRTELSANESLTLKISGDGSGGDFSPQFDSPGLEVINQFESSSFSSVYINGQFENKSEKSTTYVLRPEKVGTLRITNIRSGSDRAPDISIQVSGDAPGNRKKLPGEAPAMNGDDRNFFVKAEVAKPKFFKGEQVIVSYYLYRRTRANIRDVMQYPTFQGFIREDLEMPVLSGRFDFEAVNLGGIPFERALLARYALYPIKEGKLKIDSFAIRADYIPKNLANDDLLEDPFFQFFSQVTPRTGVSRSDPIQIEISNLPAEGKSALFSGAVGDYSVSAQLDPGNYRKGSPLSLKIILEGKGNASLIDFPRVNWPKEFKFYESQGRSKNLGQGTSEKIFDVVLIPQATGALEIPAIEFEIFNPDTRTYIKKKTAPIPLVVAEGETSSNSPLAPTEDPTANATTTAVASEPKDWGALRTQQLPDDGRIGFLNQPWWRWVAWGGLLVFFAFIGLVIWDQIRIRSRLQLDALKKRQRHQGFWTDIEKQLDSSVFEAADLAAILSLLQRSEQEVHRILDQRLGISSRALPRIELGRLFVQAYGTEQESASLIRWQQLTDFFEFYERIKIVGIQSHETLHTIRTQARDLLLKAKTVCTEILPSNP